MKMHEFLSFLGELEKECPDFMEMDVVTSSDDEGNSYNAVYYASSIGHYDKNDRDFDEEVPKKKYNAVCLN